MTNECMEDFYEALLGENKDNDFAPVIDYIMSHPNDRGYYAVCRSVLAIALNSQRTMDEDGTIRGCYQFKDIVFAVVEIDRFMTKTGIKDAISLLRMVKHRYQDSATSVELEQSIGVARNEGYYDQPFSLFGTCYNFLEITAWDNVEINILNILSEMQKK